MICASSLLSPSVPVSEELLLELEELDELELLEELEAELLDGLLELEEPPPAPPPELLSEDALELLLEEELPEPLFPPPLPPPPQAVSIETDIAAASTTAMTLSDNLMINSSHFSESRRETLFSHLCQQHTTPPKVNCKQIVKSLGERTKIGLTSHQFDHERIFILRF